MNLEALLGEANRTLEAGDHAGALPFWRQLAERLPEEAGVLVNLGLCYEKVGDRSSAIDTYRRALLLNPRLTAVQFNLANALRRNQQLQEAEALYRETLNISSRHRGALVNLAALLGNSGQFQEATTLLRRALAIQETATARLQLAQFLRGAGQPDIAVREMAAIARQSQDPELLIEYARCLEAVGQLDACIETTGRLLDIGKHAHVVESMVLNGVCQIRRYKIAEAEASFRSALEIEPNSELAATNLVGALLGRGCLQEARELANRFSIPQLPEHLNNLGTYYLRTHQFGRAESIFRESISRHNDPLAEFNLGRLLLLQDRFAEGWTAYESRLEVKGPGRIAEPRWTGQALNSKTLLLQAEQGIGDTLQAARYCRELSVAGASVVVRCSSVLVECLRCCEGIDEVMDQNESMPGLESYDFAAPMMSLPALLGENLFHDRHKDPYLTVPPVLSALWAERLSSLDGIRVGINWQGNPDFHGDRWRSIPLAAWQPLVDADLPVSWISLQKGEPGKAQLLDVSFADLLIDPDKMIETDRSLLDSAAIIQQLDLVITSCSSIAHLAGALGKTTWVLLGTDSDWRWGLVRNHSPWYPNTRLFRQGEPGDWVGVLDRVTAALTDWCGDAQH